MKHAVILGSSKGIGLGLAKEFLRLGFSVTITGTSENSLVNAKEELSEQFPLEKIKFVTCKIQNPSDVEKVWEETTKDFKNIDYWINNAGIGQSRKLFWELELSEISNLIDINIKGQMMATKIVFEKMQIQGFGSIYNMLGYGYNGSKMLRMTLYGTSKNALNYFLESFVNETKNSKIIIGGLVPGMVVTDLLMKPIDNENSERQHFEKIVNILADKVETISPFLVKNIIKNKKHGKIINWLTSSKASWRFISYGFTKRNILDKN